MTKYYANISGAANVQVPFNPYQVYTGNGNYVKLEVNCDNLRTDRTRNNAAVWINSTSGWFSFEMYGLGWEYFNLGSITYFGRYGHWSTSGFEETLVLEVNNRAVTLTEGQQTSATTFFGNFANSNISFFPTTNGVNTRVNFYEWKAYGANNTLLFDFVPDYDGTTKGLRDKVSGNFYAATNQSKIELIGLSTFETDVTAITATYSATTSSVTLTADEDMAWTASTLNDWITLSTTGGTGSSVFTVSVATNKAYAARNGLVTLTNGEDVIEITVEQAKYPLFIPNENIYRADLEVVKGYRSGSTINKAYRSGELIYYKLDYSQPTPPDYRSMPLTFKVISGGTISWRANSSAYTKEIQYSINDGAWVSITSTTAGTPISLNTDDIVKFQGDGAISTGQNATNRFRDSTIVFEVYGNIMSLIDSTGFTTATTAPDHSFRSLFQVQTGLTSVENLVLPATTIGTNVYKRMFSGCTSLTTAPSVLPATVLTESCYSEMFRGCTSLTSTPSLPATTLALNCYQNMFRACTSLNYIKCLATDITAGSCTSNWVNGVSSTGTFVTPSSTEWTTGNSGIPSGWTRVNA